MKITEFKIKSLHGFFDYDIKLNEDLTFIYGENGSGKTTVLNMLDSVVSGEIYNLFKYNFKKIIVNFENRNSNRKCNIEVKLHKEDSKLDSYLFINFTGEDGNTLKDKIYYREEEFGESYFHSKKLLKIIRETFNYIFLPLNRLSYKKGSLESVTSRNRINHQPYFVNKVYSNEDMNGVEKLVKNFVAITNSKINKLNIGFRQDILKSALEITDDKESDNYLLNASEEVLVSKFESIKNKYIELLVELKAINSEEQQISGAKYFDDLIKKVKDNIEKKPGTPNLHTELRGAYVELIRISKLIELHEELNKKITKLKTPIDEFIKYTNRFLNNGKDKKNLVISSAGQIYFTTNYTNEKVKLKYLSSGEKHVVTLFANLIFKLKRDEFTIFIVDEPELSLHLSWQKMLVETIREINTNMQIVLATHSPEIVGRYAEKVFELQKMYESIDEERDNLEDIEFSKVLKDLEDVEFSKILKDLEDIEYELFDMGDNDD